MCEFMFTGDGLYRHHEPSRFLSRLPGVTVIDCHATHRHLWPLVHEADVLVLCVLSGWELFPLIERRRQEGKITVLETNDYFHEMQPWNPIADFWLDPDLQAEHLEYIKTVDAIQTSTPRLVEHWKPYARESIVFPNQMTSIPPLPPLPERPLTIGWAGSQGHLADWYVVTRTLQKWLDAHPDVNVAVMTHALAKDFLRLPPERYYFQQAGILDEYFQFLPRLDIGIAPLEDIEYNRCRSDVKFLEYASRGIVGIYSDLGPYNQTVKAGKTGFLYSNETELLKHLDKLYADRKLLEKVRAQAYEEVSTTRRLEDHIKTRYDFYRARLKKDPWTGALPPALLEGAEREGNYVRLISGKPEEPLLTALGSKPEVAMIESLRQLVSRHPKYFLAARHLSKVCNDVGRPQESLVASDYALKLYPGSGTVHSEIGRSHYLMGNHAQAFHWLYEAVRHAPAEARCWAYLLRYLRKHPAPGTEHILSEVPKRHPQSFRLALLALSFLKPDEALKKLLAVITEFEKKLSQRQWDVAAGEFVNAIESLAGPQIDSPDARKVLKKAAGLFPHSARVATLSARALRAEGKHAQSDKELRRAYQIFRSAKTLGAEYQPDDFTFYSWQIAEALAGKKS